MADVVTNAKIVDVEIRLAEGCLTCDLQLEGLGWNGTFGGYCLKSGATRESKDLTGFYIKKLFYVFQVSSITELINMPCRVILKDGKRLYSIGHFLQEVWFTPAEELAPSPEPENVPKDESK